MPETAQKRLLKVAKEINVGLQTIVEYLDTKGIKVQANPNAKIEADAYTLLLEKFQPDMLVKQKKEESKKQAERDREEFMKHDVSRKDRNAKEEEILITEEDIDKALIKSAAAEKETAQMEPIPTKEPEVKKLTPEPVETPPVPTVEKVEVVEIKEPEHKEPEIVDEPVKTPPVEEVIVSENSPSPIIEEPVSTVEPDASPEQVDVIEAKPETKGLKILGKIDLSQTTGKPKKKEKPAEQIPESSSTKTTELPQDTKEGDAPIVAEIESVDETISEETKLPESTDTVADVAPIASKENELKGLTVIGKIDLDQFKPKKKPQPVASTSDLDSLKKKKRKRKKIGTEGGPATTGTNTAQGQGQGSRGPGAQRPPAAGGNQGPNQNNRNPQQGRNNNGPQGDNRGQRPPLAAKPEVDDKQIQTQIKETLNRLTGKDAKGQNKAKLKKKKRDVQRQRAEEEQAEIESSSKILQVTEFITANELANLMDVSVTQVITACMNLGLMVSINQRIDAETIMVVADEFGFAVQFKDVEMDSPSLEEDDTAERVISRPPIVTIMGHVDHGKTSLLDYIRKSNVIAGEAGGITQHIGAYEVTLEDGKHITFLDTPGHEAFTAMRARGAKVTDIVIVVIAADDRIMPQTKEAISHAQAAGVPIVFAINKVDREAANPESIKQQLAEMDFLVEDWGGKYQSQEISAKTGLNVNLLLEKVLFEAELLDMKADPGKRAVGTVIEATLDKGRGYVTTILVQSGTLKIGDNVLAGANSGKVKAMFNERGIRVKEAGPSTPVQILAFDGAATAGDRIYVAATEADAKQIAAERQQLIREQGIRATKHITLTEIGRRIAVGNFQELKVIVKGDMDGSVEALSDSLLKLSTPEIQVNVIHKGVGQISESDVNLAAASDAVIVGFQVRPSINARSIAEKEQIDIRLYHVIYDAIDELKLAMEGMLQPDKEEKIVANVEVRDVFKISKVGTIAGCYVTSGKINRNSRVRLIREGVVKWEGELASLKRYKDDVKEVATGYECGLNLQGNNDIKVDDYIEAFEIVEVKRKL